MIGQAGTGSPEAGIVLRVDPPCSCLHLAAGDEKRHPRAPTDQNRLGSRPVCTERGYPAASSPWYFFFVWWQVSPLPGIGLSLASHFIRPFRAAMRQTFW